MRISGFSSLFAAIAVFLALSAKCADNTAIALKREANPEILTNSMRTRLSRCFESKDFGHRARLEPWVETAPIEGFCQRRCDGRHNKSWFLGKGWGKQFFSFQSPAVQWMARTSSLNRLSCKYPYQTPHSLNCLPPLPWKTLFFTENCFVAPPSQKLALIQVLLNFPCERLSVSSLVQIHSTSCVLTTPTLEIFNGSYRSISP